MSPTLDDLLATDAALDLIASREFSAGDDEVLTGLAALALAIDRPDVPALDLRSRPEILPASKGSSHVHRGGVALVATVAVVLSSSGVAAAMSGDALAPFHFVAKRILELGPSSGARNPGWDLDGMERVTTLRSTGIRTARSAGDLGGTSSAAVPDRRDWLWYGTIHGHSRSPGLGIGTHGIGPRVPGRDHSPSAHGGDPPGGGAPGTPSGPGVTQGNGSSPGLRPPTDPRRNRGHGGIGSGLTLHEPGLSHPAYPAPVPRSPRVTSGPAPTSSGLGSGAAAAASAPLTPVTQPVASDAAMDAPAAALTTAPAE